MSDSTHEEIKENKTGLIIRRFIQALPLAAIMVSSTLPVQPVVRQGLVLATLIWLQIVLFTEVFIFYGK